MPEEPQLNSSGNRRGMSENSHKNIVSAQKALKDNNHASKDYSITRVLKETIDDPCPNRWLEPDDKDKGLTWRQAIAMRMKIEAVKGNSKIMSDIMDRLEGKVTQPVNNSGEMIIRVKYEEDAGG